MAYSKRYNLPYRRQREGKTNYKSRLALLKSSTPRLVVRRTNKYILAQVITYSPDGDKILVGASSQDLKKLGWSAATNNLPAAYLTGFLIGKKILHANIPGVIADFGLQKVAHQGNLYSCLKGVVDAGVSIPVREEFFPEESRISGEHIKSYASSSASKNQFSKTKTAAQSLPALFSKTKQQISNGK